MERTQIYLSETHTRELDRRARNQGTTRSHLVREAVEQYLKADWDPDRFVRALHGVAGMWADRDDIAGTYQDLKQRDRDRLRGLWGDQAGDDAGAPAPEP